MADDVTITTLPAQTAVVVSSRASRTALGERMGEAVGRLSPSSGSMTWIQGGGRAPCHRPEHGARAMAGHGPAGPATEEETP